MILHSIRIGERHIHVRTDDCDQRELERVHETVRLVQRMLNRHGNEAYGILMGLVMFLGSMVIALSTMLSGAAKIAIPSVVGIMYGAMGWYLVHDVVQRRQLADAARLWTLTAESIRCRDFVIECTEASPALSRIRIRRPQPA